MREIKFRVWTGFEMEYNVTVGKFGTFYVNPSNNGLDPNDSASLTPFTTKYSDTTPVMQFTGLKDKNGKEVYEGDIVKCHDHPTGVEDAIGEINFDQGRYWVGTNSICSLDDYGTAWTEVLGNKYQNPELL